MNSHQIIIRPLITEKNTNLMVFNKYCFEVDREATKAQIGWRSKRSSTSR